MSLGDLLFSEGKWRMRRSGEEDLGRGTGKEWREEGLRLGSKIGEENEEIREKYK